MRYFFCRSLEDSTAEEITRDVACKLIESTYGSDTNMLTQLEDGQGTNCSIHEGQIFVTGALDRSNELLRSAYAVVLRKGVDTNWDALKANLEKELLAEAGAPVGCTEEQIILRATCTPKTYRLPE